MRSIVITEKYVYVPNNRTKSTTIIPISAIPNNDIDRLLQDFVPGGVVLLNRTDGVVVVRNKQLKKYK